MAPSVRRRRLPTRASPLPGESMPKTAADHPQRWNAHDNGCKNSLTNRWRLSRQRQLRPSAAGLVALALRGPSNAGPVCGAGARCRRAASDLVILRPPFSVRTISGRPRGSSSGRARSCPLQGCRFDSGPRGPWTTKARRPAGLRVAHKSQLSTVKRMVLLRVQVNTGAWVGFSPARSNGVRPIS